MSWDEYADDSVEASIPRDRWGRPVIITPDGRKAYTRVTTFADTLEDRYGLEGWQQRMVAIGLAKRKDLLMSVSAHNTDSPDDKKILNALCEQAKEAAGSSAAATTGTALHRLAERVDRGALSIEDAPESTQADLRAYRSAMAELEILGVERFVVLDDLLVAGTFDRTVRYGNDTYVADIKTGSLEYGVTKMAVQLALYARGALYDPKTGERTEQNLNRRAGLIIHLPAGKGLCSIYWLNIFDADDAIEHSAWTRKWRKRRDLLVSTGLAGEGKVDNPLAGTAHAGVSATVSAITASLQREVDRVQAADCADCDHDTHRCKGCGTAVPHGTVGCEACLAEATLTETLGATRVPALQQVQEARTVEAIEAAYYEYESEWTDELTAAAAARKRELTEAAFAGVDPPDPAPPTDTLGASIKRCRSVASLEKLWADNQDRWTAEHTDLARARRHALSLRTLTNASA